MRYRFAILLLVVNIAGVRLVRTQGQTSQHGQIVVPDTTVERPEDIGKRAHTNHLIFASPGLTGSSPNGETPASLACVYQTASTLVTGCPIKGTTAVPTGGNGIIAIVDAFDYPTAQSDFDTFSKQFGLPLSTDNVCNGTNPCFTKKYATSQPHANNCWDLEAALDIEWSHAMSPHAQIVLVVAASNSFSDLLTAVDVATSTILAGGKNGGIAAGEVSMSWGGSEFSSETSYDSHFSNSANPVVYFAASGDSGVVLYPSASPYVVSAGGTSVNRDSSGNFVGETGWSGSGGGPSAYELIPSYQSVIAAIVGSQRGTPDFSYDANPSTGVSIFDSSKPCQGFSGWVKVGGTSVASPSLSGIVNLAGHFYYNTNEQSTIYADYGSTSYSSDFNDITSGSTAFNSAKLGWDFVTGVGSNKGLSGK